MGKVFIVKPVGLEGISDRFFAMKRLKKKSVIENKNVSRVLVERQILMTANHPFICTMYYSFQTKTKVYFIMQYCAGGEFFRMLKMLPGKRLTENAAKFYAAEILLALEYLHLLGYYYRDLKPENILVHETGHVMLTDFDLSKASGIGANPRLQNVKDRTKRKTISNLFGLRSPRKKVVDTDSNISIEKTKSMLGTFEYMSREMLIGKGYGSSSDWWSFGVLVYEMIFSRTPFKGITWQRTLKNISKDQDIDIPADPAISEACANFMRSIFWSSKTKNRLDSALKIKEHPFFRDVNFQLIRNEKPPIVPKLRRDGVLDTTCMYKRRAEAESDVSSEEEEGEEEESDTAAKERGGKAMFGSELYCDDFYDGFEGFAWSRGVPDPHWTLDPTVADSPASALSPHSKGP